MPAVAIPAFLDLIFGDKNQIQKWDCSPKNIVQHESDGLAVYPKEIRGLCRDMPMQRVSVDVATEIFDIFTVSLPQKFYG